MKKLNDILVVKKEEDKALVKRREDYALKRDLQATEQNEAITKRLISEESAKVKCVKCGKEFSPEDSSSDYLECPECR
jgi:hypothetical protein